jgi:CheY-like chemotaxis protein
VLLVDDNKDLANSLVVLLRSAGVDVRAVYSGATTIAAALEFRPNVILLDIGLPDIDGYDVARLLRQNSELKDVCLIALTGYGRDADRQLSEAVGIDYHVTKPVEPQRLVEFLATVGAGTTRKSRLNRSGEIAVVDSGRDIEPLVDRSR